MKKMDQMEKMEKMLANTKYEDQGKLPIVHRAQRRNRKRDAKKRNQQKGIPGYTQVSSESTSSDEDVYCITGWQLEYFGFAENHRAFEH